MDIKKTVVHVLVVLLLCSLALVLPVTAAVNGKIAFTSDRAGNYDIYVMNPDGTGQTQLTTNSASDNDPIWSPDGSKIVFNSSRDGNDEIYVMNSDGTDQTSLTKSSGSDTLPAMSLNGKKIAFTSNRDGNDEIYVMNSDGTSQTRITMNAASDTEPAWSPDGTKIAFASNRAGNFDIYVMNADGTGQTSLTNNLQYDSRPAWSPDGKKIAFETNRDGTWTYNIWIMNADGTGQTRLTLQDDVQPAWSPDGTEIAFCSWRGNAIQKIFIMNPDGSGQTQITSSSLQGNNSGPAWWSTAAPTITITSPNGGESWQPGTTHPVTWSYTGSPGSYVKVILLKEGVAVGTATYSTPIGSGGTGSYQWAISSTRAPGTDYQIVVQSTTQPTVKGTSGYFTIGAPPLSSIKVIVPNGGEIWKRGTPQSVTWSYTGNPGPNVKIELLQGGTPVGTATYSTPTAPGSYTWAISSGRAPGTNYRIRITSVSQPTIIDTSNGNFAITA